ncbi:hypothetical protein P4S95_16255 [Aneurinibacillus aneurinilyticus]|uniref:hypothetical protein n=1 Tax=Aneurinibacillus aneurinilyticus TaxID=1391 RepID=UPI002E1A8B1B|nr:hypothetical protein [Aneurinibacillus aneurinilyticus]
MEINKQEFKSFLSDIGVTHLHHANTVLTACSFIKCGGLLSRGAVEHLGLKQTPQDSDDIDKQFGVWDDIFLDSVDLHDLFPRQNLYGPVVFKFSLDVLDHEELPVIWITKDNPIRWTKEQSPEQRYFKDITELKDSYSLGSYQEMITLRSTHSPLPFSPFLEEIILDNPGLAVSDVSLFKEAGNILKQALKESDFDYSHVKLTTRKCKKSPCYCRDNYLKQYGADKLKLFFLN